jgi:hypothetical protein
MKYFFLYFFLLTVLGLNCSFGQVSSKEWDHLISKAHDIGLCAYALNQNRCDLHDNEAQKRKQKTNEEEVIYFVLKEEWAKNRIKKWAEKYDSKQENVLILFDIRQGEYPVKSDKFKGGLNGFLLFDLAEGPKVTVRQLDEHTLRCSFKKEKGSPILYNYLWREFMTGRLGIIETSTQFDICTDGNTGKKYLEFKAAYSNYQKKITQ